MEDDLNPLGEATGEEEAESQGEGEWSLQEAKSAASRRPLPAVPGTPRPLSFDIVLG